MIKCLRISCATVLALLVVGVSACGDQHVGVPSALNLERERPATLGSIDEFPVPMCPGGTCSPEGITLGPNGEIWFTNFNGDEPGEIDTSGNFQQFSVSGSNGHLLGIATSVDGNLWMAAPGLGDGQLIRMTPQGATTIYSVPGQQLWGPTDIASGAGGDLWFNDAPARAIGVMTPDGSLSVYALPPGSHPGAITRGLDSSSMWFGNSNRRGGKPICKLGKITTAGIITEHSFTPCDGPTAIAVGPDNRFWFTNGNLIGRMSSSGFSREFPIPESGAQAIGIAAGPDGNMWFTEVNGATEQGWIVRFNPLQPTQMTEFPLPSGGAQDPYFITTGADGNMWFTIPGISAIGRIHLH